MDDKPQETGSGNDTRGQNETRGRVSRGRRVRFGSAAAGCAVLGGVLVLLPWERGTEAPPDPVLGALARAAVASGVPASLPGLEALVEERERHLEKHPKDAESWAVLGAARVEQGRRLADPARYSRAEQALRTSLKVRPRGNAAALRGLAALANARRDHPVALEWGERARKLEPERWTTYPPLVEAHAGLGDGKAAGRMLDRLKALRSDPAVMALAAAVYRDKGLREDAAAQLADAAAAAGQPAERAAYLERAGQLAWEHGDREDALGHFREAVRVDPDQRAARAGQGRALAALGRTTEALGAYRAALAGQPLPEYELELGELYESLGLRRDARVHYDLVRSRVREAAAHGADGDLVLGRFEADHGDPRAAVRRLRTEWKRQPSTEVADALGWALHRAGRSEEALEFAVRATEGATEGTTEGAHDGGALNALHAFHRGMIERELERYGPARRHLREALRINPHFSPLRVPQAKAALERLGEPSVGDGPPDWS
ncbi:tetratricopeptide repeat protein [Streptomyces sp. NBC_01635]|uniref:tetratricopeptide repeat protein n=1 Tax=Streptomyces sp. NBC_01635 TaxID=2975904 RepID=UPI0038689F39|nr:tetratricopeptide repeat protein [Streptomyces sp. NBC_01635]